MFRLREYFGLYPSSIMKASMRRCSRWSPLSDRPMIVPPHPAQVSVQIPDSVVLRSRQDCRVYVGNIPPDITKVQLVEFFNQQMYRLVHSHSSVVACRGFLGKRYAFVEFRTLSESTKALTLDGIDFIGYSLKVRRVEKYPQVASKPAFVSPTAKVQSSNTIYIGALPECLTEDDIKPVFLAFGRLRYFRLVQDSITGQHKGFGFCEYEDAAVTDMCIDTLNWLPLGGKKLVVQRDIVGANRVWDAARPVLPDPNLSPTEVLCLLYMVTPAELRDDEKSQEILRIIGEECSKYGWVQRAVMPRPIGGMDVPGCGKVFVSFNSVLDCQNARQALAGRKFNDREVVTYYYDPDKFHRSEF